MQHAVAASSARVPHGRRSLARGNGHHPSTVTKRDGSVVGYDRHKVFRAIYRCLVNSCNWPQNDHTDHEADRVAEQVEQLLLFQDGSVTVEAIQDLVEQQLMARGHHQEAKEYILYREEHRRLREERPVDPKIQEAFQEGCSHFTGPNQAVRVFQAFDKFARFDWEKGRRETWPESVDRVLCYSRNHVHRRCGPDAVDDSTWLDLRDALLKQEASPAMRLVQMAGPALERCQTGVFNCSFQFLQNPQDMAEELYLLMQGCGVGFSVESAHATDRWPRVRKQKRGQPTRFAIPDTTEGWCDAYKTGLEHWLSGHDVVYDFSQIRPEGSILKTKGGRASGPQPLRDLLTFARSRILTVQGKRLSSLDLHDINCYAHRIVQMGGVRRASGISLSDLDDDLMRDCKAGEFWNHNPQRNQANNSAVYDERPDALTFMEEWMSLAKSGSGERGIFNRGALRKQFPKRRSMKGQIFGTNPCGEINLRHKQFCNLSIAVVRGDISEREIFRRVELATLWGTIQSSMTDFSYVDPLWKKNCEEEALLGVDMLGHLDHSMLRPGATDLAQRLSELKQHAIDTNRTWAQRLGVNESVAVTCGKPSGDSSVFFDCAPGFKAWHGQFYIRRVRANNTNPVAKMLAAQGVPCHVDYDNAGLLVLEFPCRAPEGALLLGQMTAIEQLEHWKKYKLHWCEHNPSVTIYVKDHEWFEVGNWVYGNWDIVGGLAFQPFDGGIYPLAPYETIDEDEYERRAKAMPEIEWWKLIRYEDSDYTDLAQQCACVGGACEV